MRRLKPDPVPDDLVWKILEAAIRAPSGGNRQPWNFIVIRDAETKKKIAAWYLEAWNASYGPMKDVMLANPESARGQNGVGLVLMQLKNYEEASQAFDRALVLDPGNARYRQAVNDARRLQKAASALEEKGKETVKGMLNEQPGKKR